MIDMKMTKLEERAHLFGIKRAGGHYEGGTKGMIYEGSKELYMEIAKKETNDLYFKARKVFCDTCPNKKKCDETNDSIDSGDILKCKHFNDFADLLKQKMEE